jgi:gas vesicle protein
MRRRTNQGGSVASYILIGVILVVGLVAGIYFLNQSGQQARKSQEQSPAISGVSTTTKKSNSSNTNSQNKTTSTTTQPKTANQTKSQNMPTTGPEVSVFELVGVYLLAASVAGYLLSRESSVRSL